MFRTIYIPKFQGNNKQNDQRSFTRRLLQTQTVLKNLGIVVLTLNEDTCSSQSNYKQFLSSTHRTESNVVMPPNRHHFKITLKNLNLDSTCEKTFSSWKLLEVITCDLTKLLTENDFWTKNSLSWILIFHFNVDIRLEYNVISINPCNYNELSICYSSTKRMKDTTVFHFVLHSRGKGVFKRRLYKRFEFTVKVLGKVLNCFHASFKGLKLQVN